MDGMEVVVKLPELISVCHLFLVFNRASVVASCSSFVHVGGVV